MSGSSPASRELTSLVEAACAHDNAAWTELIGRFERMLRMIVRSYRLNDADIDDVLQTVWLRLHEHLGRLRDPNAIAGWLATTARRESLRLLQMHTREVLTDDHRQISATLHMPLGSIGPTRARSLTRLGSHRELRALHLVAG